MKKIKVGTTLPEPTYELLRRGAKSKGKTVEAIAREAIEAYLPASFPSKKDPLVSLIGRGTLRERDLSVRKDWRA